MDTTERDAKMQAAFNAIMKPHRDAVGRATMTLGAIIEVLRRAKPEAWLATYPVEGLKLTTLESWRGIYEHLAIGYELSDDGVKVGNLLSEFESAVGKTFTGYKGGNYVMGLDTPVWLANYGKGSSSTIDRIVIDETGNVEVYIGHADNPT